VVHILHCIVFKLLKTKKLKKCIMNGVQVGTHCNSVLVGTHCNSVQVGTHCNSVQVGTQCNSVAFRGVHSEKTWRMCHWALKYWSFG
jgi:hypothetical protein